MPFCGNCGHPLSDTDLTCPNCGEIRPNAIPKPDSINQEPTAPTPDTPTEPNLHPEQSDSNATAPVSDNYDHVAAYQNNTQADTPVANDIPREVPQPDASATQNTTAETNAAPDFPLMTSATTTFRTETLPTSSNRIFRDNFSSSQLLVNPLTLTTATTRPRTRH